MSLRSIISCRTLDERRKGSTKKVIPRKRMLRAPPSSLNSTYMTLYTSSLAGWRMIKKRREEFFLLMNIIFLSAIISSPCSMMSCNLISWFLSLLSRFSRELITTLSFTTFTSLLRWQILFIRCCRKRERGEKSIFCKAEEGIKNGKITFNFPHWRLTAIDFRRRHCRRAIKALWTLCKSRLSVKEREKMNNKIINSIHNLLSTSIHCCLMLLHAVNRWDEFLSQHLQLVREGEEQHTPFLILWKFNCWKCSRNINFYYHNELSFPLKAIKTLLFAYFT